MRRALVAVPGALASVWVLRLILGPWATALVVAPVGVTAVVCTMWLVDRRLCAPPPPAPRRMGPVVDVTGRRSLPIAATAREAAPDVTPSE